ncbi:MAG TPA: RteC domain-containing protein [Chitinophagaceae bacterium]|nr:RteC domain-containing protein [Chitinophagaceae bacterium]
MIHDIVRCMQLELPESERVESCFWIANNYWDKLKAMMKRTKFKDDSEEVDFFRNVKPRFTCHIEYYAILSEALQFVPKDQKAVIHFWKEEHKRFARFCSKNETFVSFYESGEQYGNCIYFLRENKQPGIPIAVVPYDADENLCTSHDRVLRSYLAHKMYNDYVRGKIKSLIRHDAES